MKKYRRVYADLDLDAVLFNFSQMSRLLPEGTKIMAVVKADAYGHGAVPLAGFLEPLENLWGFATATVDEALELRRAGIRKPILILGYTFPECCADIVREGLHQTVFSMELAKALSEEAVRQGKEAFVHIKLDTGMGRIGYQDGACAVEAALKMQALPNLRLEGVFTHFANADTADQTFTMMQTERFEKAAVAMEAAGIRIPVKHCANSAGILAHSVPKFDVVRAGIISYGLWPSEETDHTAVTLQPVLSLKSHVVYVKEVEAGTPVSYGSTWVAEKRRTIATIPVGYGDGYPRSLSNKGYVLIRGQKAPIVGRVCMDQLMVDVTGISDPVNVGDEVTLIGRDGKLSVTAEELGDLSGRFNYELVCDLGNRIPRIYYKNGKMKEIRDYFDK